MSDPLKPTPQILIALGSIAVHADEFFSPNGHAFDKIALRTALDMPEVQEWIGEMNKLALLPLKR